MSKIIPVSKLRKNLPDLIDEVATFSSRVVVTVNGQPKAMLVSIDEMEAIEATLETLLDPMAMADFREGMADIEAGRVHNWEDVKRELDLE